MRFSTIAVVGVFSVVSAIALAGPFGPAQTPGNIPPRAKGSIFQPYECAPGFTMSNGSGSSEEAWSWDCQTLVLTCPPAQEGMSGGLKNPAAMPSQSGLDVQFKYTCSWVKKPK